jgi:hypothetical protein
MSLVIITLLREWSRVVCRGSHAGSRLFPLMDDARLIAGIIIVVRTRLRGVSFGRCDATIVFSLSLVGSLTQLRQFINYSTEASTTIPVNSRPLSTSHRLESQSGSIVASEDSNTISHTATFPI